MKNKILCLVVNCLFFFGNYAIGQTPDIAWQKTLGGSSDDVCTEVHQTTDGGFIIGGYSVSPLSGNKTEDLIGGYDYWVIKTDANGNVLWQNTIGGTAHDRLKSIIQTTDGGFIAAGESSSDISGDKTENHYPPLLSEPDFWIVKINAAGVIEWDNTIGTSSTDNLGKIIATPDNGCVLLGNCYNGPDYDLTDFVHGGPFPSLNVWVIKLNSTGIIEWQNALGGNKTDQFGDIACTADGGYIVGATSYSDASWDKSEPRFGAVNYPDYWVIKLNETGVKEWDHTFGGTRSDVLTSIMQTSDGGYLVGGNTKSQISGNKTEDKIGNGDATDYWVIKLDNIGAIEWQNDIGGNYYDFLKDMDETSEGDFIIGGESESALGYDKSEPSMFGDYWIVKLGVLGNIQWDKTIGGSDWDELNSVEQTTDGGFILGGFSSSGISGDKTEPAFDDIWFDYWVIKLEPACVFTTESCNGIDDNCNGIIDDDVVETITISASGATILCQGETVTLNAVSSSATYQWQKNDVDIPGETLSSITVNSKGNYTCVTNSICGSAESNGIYINVQKNPAASISAGGPTTFCAGGSVVLNEVAISGCDYQWYKGATLISGATGLSYTATMPGNYKCRVTKTATGCFKNSNAIAVSVTCKEGEMYNDENAFSIYPNPNNGTFTIQTNVMTQDFASPESTIEIYNNLGQLIFSKKVISNDGIINELIELNNITPGIYIVKLWNNNIYNVKNIVME